MGKRYTTELHDHCGTTPEQSIKATAILGRLCILVGAEGFGTMNTEGDEPMVMVEYWEGELRVLVWSDINQEDPTHIISLEGAKHEARKEE